MSFWEFIGTLIIVSVIMGKIEDIVREGRKQRRKKELDQP